MTSLSPEEWRAKAVAAQQAGDGAALLEIADRAVREHPDHGALHNSLGNILLRAGHGQEAEQYFASASRLEAANSEFATNHAIALTRLGRSEEALIALERAEQQGRRSAAYCSTRANAERQLGHMDAAAEWFDRALEIEPSRPKALHGRARIALQRGEDDAVHRFDRALQVNSGEADLWLGKAQALDADGDSEAAREIMAAIVAQAPQWTDALQFLAQLRHAAGERDFADHFAAAANPQDAAVVLAHAGTLAGLDRNEEAAGIVADARLRFDGDPRFALFEAIYRGAAGDDAAAERIFEALQLDTPERALHEARHRIRLEDPERADALLDIVLASDPWSVSAWALRAVAWRLSGDDRSCWLSDQPGLVSSLPLVDEVDVAERVVPLLHELHNGSPLPLGQSLRGGTQTRGILFDRLDEPLRQLHAAILETVAQYRSQLPLFDAKHPLLRHRDSEWGLAGSWSVRLSGGGDFHTAHIHPQGIVSSALYLEVPQGPEVDPKAGWLEIGRPASDLRTGLEPIHTIEPKPGRLALFPSYLYHGTRPFRGSRRLTVAFDIVVDGKGPE